MILSTGQLSTSETLPGRESWVQGQLRVKSWVSLQTGTYLSWRVKESCQVTWCLRRKAFFALMCSEEDKRIKTNLSCDHELGCFCRERRTPGTQT